MVVIPLACPNLMLPDSTTNREISSQIAGFSRKSKARIAHPVFGKFPLSQVGYSYWRVIDRLCWFVGRLGELTQGNLQRLRESSAFPKKSARSPLITATAKKNILKQI
jgi:hypothetical protein